MCNYTKDDGKAWSKTGLERLAMRVRANFKKRSMTGFASGILGKVIVWDGRNDPKSIKVTEYDAYNNTSHTKKNLNDPMIKYTLIDDCRIEAIYREIIVEMEEHYIYRDRDLSVDSLAIILNTNNTYVSMAINKVGHTTYPKLINSYRITEVIQLMEEYGNSLTNKEIAHKVGYRDLSTFYKYFKEITGCTPSEYINSHSQMN